MTNETGIKSLTGDKFHPLAALGGIRGIIEAMAPGAVFVIVFVATRELLAPVISAGAIALIAVIARLIQRTPITQAFSGVIGVGIGVIWAWRSGAAENYYLWGLLTNAAYLLPILVSILVRWPVVGLIAEGLKAGLTDAGKIERGETKGWTSWRRNPEMMRRYQLATWLWVGLFGLRLVVQVPLYLAQEVGYLGTARLVMGVPLWAVTLWLTWMLVRTPDEDPVDDVAAGRAVGVADSTEVAAGPGVGVADSTDVAAGRAVGVADSTDVAAGRAVGVADSTDVAAGRAVGVADSTDVAGD
ncbi:hypothetical protein GCM10010401_23130 [Rarobacter faecitabidus]|uniref:Uncharacterized protein DUF3159 n=1 Tax=Rarobacter faecitabidus TaxID=13243 RepID=A0A542ZW13_RARFA|nr:DUF3159 domain-containing protein [Rarobacter faecitabidus]TQL64545.1 uncharacterized protein DUF3159 [Rarobacter faecitabidus]